MMVGFWEKVFPCGVMRIVDRPLQDTLRSYTGGVQTNELHCVREKKLKRKKKEIKRNFHLIVLVDMRILIPCAHANVEIHLQQHLGQLDSLVESSYFTRELKLVAKTLTVSESDYLV